jgi:integrase
MATSKSKLTGRSRKLPTGMWLRGRTYYAKFKKNGREIRKSLSTDYRVACEMLNDLKAKVDRGDYGILDNDAPWDEIKAAFMRWAKQSVRNPQDYARDLRRFEDYCHPRTVHSVTPERIHAYRELRLDQGVTARTVNREVGTIGNMFNKAVKWKRIADNPIAGVTPLPHVELAKDRRSLTLDEVQAIFSASPDRLRPVWRMLMGTGIRKGELVKLRFSDIDFDRRPITISAQIAKNKKAREIPLDDQMIAMLDELRDMADHREPVPGGTKEQTRRQRENFTRDHIFVTKANTPRRNNLLRTFYAICRKAGIEGAHPGGSVDIHSLRVSFTTLSIEHGANPRAVQAILGHSTLAMTMSVYAKATDRGKRDAINSLPFATVTPPEYVVSISDAAGVQNGVQVSGSAIKPLENKGNMA